MDTIQNIGMTRIVPGDNDRHEFNPTSLKELADSIDDHGLAQPITVRMIAKCSDCDTMTPVLDTTFNACPACHEKSIEIIYQIVAGERRFRACQTLGWDSIPAIVRHLSDEEAAAIMLCENIQRVDLSPIDEGLAYRKRMDQFGWSIQDIASHAHVSDSRVRTRLDLLELHPDIQQLINTGQLAITAGSKLVKLSPAGQLTAIRWILNQPVMPTVSAIAIFAQKLIESEASQSLFDLAELFSPVVFVIETKGSNRMKDLLPRIPGLPGANPHAAKLGNFFDDYLASLLETDHTYEAEVIADFWAKALDANWARMQPHDSVTIQRHHTFVLGQ